MSCKIRDCPSNHRKTSVFRFPTDPDMQQRWIEAIESYQKFDYSIKEFSVCMHHFLSTDVTCVGNRTNLKSNAVPCIFEPFEDNGQSTMKSTKRVYDSQLEGLTKRIKIEKASSNESMNLSGIDVNMKPCESRLLDIGNGIDNLDLLVDPNENNTDQICFKCIELDSKLKSAYKKMDWMQGKIIELRAEVERLQKSSSSSSSSSSQSNASTPLTVDEISKCKLCNTCIKTAEIEYHVCIDGGTLSCKYCIQVFTSTDSFLKHLADANHRTLMKRDREAKKFFKCNKCQLAYTMRVLLKCHKKSHEEPVLDTTPAPVKKVSDVVLSSDKNVVTVDIKQIISKPIASPLEIAHSGNYYKCAFCDMAFDSIIGLRNHKHVVEDNSGKLKPATEESAQANTKESNTKSSIIEPECQINILPKLENVSAETKEQNKPAEEMKICKLCKKSALISQHVCGTHKCLLCRYCNGRFRTTENFLRHMSKPDHVAQIKRDRENKSLFRCTLCRLAYPMAILLQCHYMSHTIEKNEKRNSSKLEKLTDAASNAVSNATLSGESGLGHKRLFKCGKCAFSFKTAPALSKHMREEHAAKRRTYECYICKLQIQNHFDALRNHMKTHSNPNGTVCLHCRDNYDENHPHLCGEEMTIQCDYCDDIFTSTIKLLTHLNNSHEQKKFYQCDKCLKYHPMLFLKKHHHCNASCENVVRPYACSICGKKFVQYSKLKMHEKGHDEAGQYLCDECGKTFKTASNFKHHQMSSLHNEPTFQCTECPRKYYSAFKLKYHLEKHRGVTYVCEICKKDFRSKQSHKKHMTIHNRTEADRRFECSICSKKFFNIKNLRKHYTVHYGDNSFKCRFCDAAYKYKGDLNKHLRIHLDGKIHECDKCPESFYYPEELETHLNEHYREERDQLNSQSTV